MQLHQLYTDDRETRAHKALSRFGYKYPDEIDMYDICWCYGVNILPLDSPFIEDLIDSASIDSLKVFSIPKTDSRRGTKEGIDPIEKKLLLAKEFCHIYSHYSPQLSTDKLLISKTENQAMKMAAADGAVLISDITDYFVVTDKFTSYRII